MAVHGWVFLDKPLGMSSNGALSAVKKILGTKKAGHTGTLDPLATGVLPIALGEATKTIPLLENAEKTYEFSVTWGELRRTGDCEGEVVETSSVRPTAEQIHAVLGEFVGEITQVPPLYSAIKINGRRAYELAREGKDFEVPERQVTIFSFECLDVQENMASFRVHCSKGTYVRTLAVDIARRLQTVGYVSKLVRTQVAYFPFSCVISLDKLREIGHSAVHPLQIVLDGILALDLVEGAVIKVRHGQKVLARYEPSHEGKAVAAFEKGVPVGLGFFEAGFFTPTRLFNLL